MYIVSIFERPTITRNFYIFGRRAFGKPENGRTTGGDIETATVADIQYVTEQNKDGFEFRVNRIEAIISRRFSIVSLRVRFIVQTLQPTEMIGTTVVTFDSGPSDDEVSSRAT